MNYTLQGSKYCSITQVCAWFLKIACSQMLVCIQVCVPASEATINQQYDMDPYDWLDKFYSLCMAAAVIIGSGRGLRIEARCEN